MRSTTSTCKNQSYNSPILVIICKIVIHRENRELAFQQLQAALASKDADLAQLQQAQSALVSELTDLRRITKREGVNLDYLKNIVLQYMVFPVASTERMQLVPVIATLLQFNQSELAEVERSGKEPLFGMGSRPVVEIKRSLTRAASAQ